MEDTYFCLKVEGEGHLLVGSPILTKSTARVAAIVALDHSLAERQEGVNLFSGSVPGVYDHHGDRVQPI